MVTNDCYNGKRNQPKEFKTENVFHRISLSVLSSVLAYCAMSTDVFTNTYCSFIQWMQSHLQLLAHPKI